MRAFRQAIKGLGWKLLAPIAALTMMVGGTTYSLYRLDQTIWHAAGPQEGYYWTVAQYQIAFYRMREQVLAVAAGEPFDADTHDVRVAVLDSKGRILTEPSELTAYFRKVEGYEVAAASVAQFQKSVIPQLEAPAFGRDAARRLIREFDQVEPPLVQLANEVRLEEIRGREATIAETLQRRTHLWMLLTASWLLLVAWVATLALSRRKYRRAAEEEREARRRERAAIDAMQQAVRAKTAFLGMVSHELRSPLQTILSALDVLELRIGAAENSEFVARIRRSANALGAQLRDLLTLAKGEAGKLEVQPETFEVCELVVGVADLFSDIAAEKGVALRCQVPDDPIFAIADPTRIEQVLTNLVSNAMKYTEQGAVTVTLQPFDASAGELLFIVSDTGPGISAEHIPSLFKAYSRFGSTGRGSRAGAGIGLAIVSTVIDHLGGKIDVSSEEGRGTTFTVRIPVALADAEVHHASEQIDRKVILVVDDREDVLEALCTVAAELGYACDRAMSAGAAANFLAARKYDVVLIDLDMPIKRGDELASETRRGGGPNAGTRMVAMSASEVCSVHTGGPFEDFMQKPIDRRALREAIESRRPGQTGLKR